MGREMMRLHPADCSNALFASRWLPLEAVDELLILPSSEVDDLSTPKQKPCKRQHTSHTAKGLQAGMADRAEELLAGWMEGQHGHGEGSLSRPQLLLLRPCKLPYGRSWPSVAQYLLALAMSRTAIVRLLTRPSSSSAQHVMSYSTYEPQPLSRRSTKVTLLCSCRRRLCRASTVDAE